MKVIGAAYQLNAGWFQIASNLNKVPLPQKSLNFLIKEKQFRLGHLITEKPNPITCGLSSLAKTDLESALRLINQVDCQIPPVFQQLAESGKLDPAIESTTGALKRGNKIFFTGCGATGRLSIQLESVWRGFWEDLKDKHADLYLRINEKLPGISERIISIMAGGDYALIKSVEGFEDQTEFGRKQISEQGLAKGDVVFATTEGGETSHVIGTAWEGIAQGAEVFFSFNNPDEVLAGIDRSREVIENSRIHKINMTTGPQAITGSTRMQAASIETLILSSILEVTLYNLLSEILSEAELKTLGFNKDKCRIRAMAKQSSKIPELVAAAIPQLAELVKLESGIYSAGGNFDQIDDPNPNQGFVLYVAGDDSVVIVLTDNTERAPTFSLKSFSSIDEMLKKVKASPSFMAIEGTDNNSAWQKVLKRTIRALDDWGYPITTSDVLKFILAGEQVLKFRPIGKGNLSIGVFLGDEVELLNNPESFQMKTLAEAKKQGGARALIAVTAKHKNEIEFPDKDEIGVQVKITDLPTSPLHIVESLVLKILLNTLSSMVMVKMGRVEGNLMTHVAASNKKLLDRATRYISILAEVPYEIANHYLFSVIQDTQADRDAGQGLPPPVLIAVERLKEAAVQRKPFAD